MGFSTCVSPLDSAGCVECFGGVYLSASCCAYRISCLRGQGYLFVYGVDHVCLLYSYQCLILLYVDYTELWELERSVGRRAVGFLNTSLSFVIVGVVVR